jgi:hypothetical protein
MARHLYTEKVVYMNTTLKNADEIGNRRRESLSMKPKSITFAAVVGLWTALTLAGSIWAVLFLTGPNSITRLDVIRSNNNMVILIVVLTVILWGGGLWGWGIARMMNADAKTMVKACALSWSATGFVAVIALVSLGTIIRSAKIFPDCRHPIHYAFLSTFIPVIGVVAAINAYVVPGKLGFHALKKSAGMYAGIAAALGFLAVGLILLFGLGWGVGEYPHKMLTLMHFCNIGAALAGGMALGWALDKSRIRLDG